VTERAKSSHEPASAKESVVFVIDDDVAMRATLSSLFRSVGLRVELFGSAHEFARIKMPDVASCLVLDIRLPRVSGLDFQAELAEADIRIPIIFMTGHGDIPMSVTEITVKVHRGHLMRKMKTRSLIDLVGMADLLGISRPKR